MASYITLTTARTTVPDSASLLTMLHVIDGSIGVQQPLGDAGSFSYKLKKSTPWVGSQIVEAQLAIDTAPVSSLQLTARNEIDKMSIAQKAIILTTLDQINFIRARLSPPQLDISVVQMIEAIKTKIGTL